MARRSEKRDEQRQGEIAFYKWEFLRRNKAYGEEYRALHDYYGKALSRAGYPNPGYSSRLKDGVQKQVGQAHFLWRVNFMQNPDARAVPLKVMRSGSNRRTQNPFWDAHGFAILSDTEVVDPRDGCGDTVRFKNLSVDFRWESDWFPLAINLEARPETLQRELMKLVRDVQRERRDTPGEAPIRLEAQSFDHYLKAWDLKQKGASLTEVVKGLGLISADEKPRKDHLQRAHRSITQAKKLIAGAYRRIS